jgi:hypothetical protein
MRPIGPRLVDLDPIFLRYDPEARLRKAPWWVNLELSPRVVTTLAEAHGVAFRCPRCRDHRVVAWFDGRGVPDLAEPLTRLHLRGSSAADLTLTPVIDCTPCWRGMITAGWISTFAG